MARDRRLARVERAAAGRLLLAARALDLQLGRREAGLGGDVGIGADEEEGRADEDHGRADRPPAPQRVGEHDEADGERGDGRARVGEEEADREQRRHRRQPARPPSPRRSDEDRREQEVRRGERAEEGRDEPAQRPLVARVVDPVLGQVREPAVVEPELVPEPARHARVAPRLQRDGVDVDEPPGRDERADARGSARRRSGARAPRASGRGRGSSRRPGSGRAGGRRGSRAPTRRRRASPAGSGRRGRRTRHRRTRASRWTSP